MEAETAPKAAPAAGGMSAVFNVGMPRGLAFAEDDVFLYGNHPQMAF